MDTFSPDLLHNTEYWLLRLKSSRPLSAKRTYCTQPRYSIWGPIRSSWREKSYHYYRSQRTRGCRLVVRPITAYSAATFHFPASVETSVVETQPCITTSGTQQPRRSKQNDIFAWSTCNEAWRKLDCRVSIEFRPAYSPLPLEGKLRPSLRAGKGVARRTPSVFSLDKPLLVTRGGENTNELERGCYLQRVRYSFVLVSSARIQNRYSSQINRAIRGVLLSSDRIPLKLAQCLYQREINFRIYSCFFQKTLR